jgi:hypothetical protein
VREVLAALELRQPVGDLRDHRDAPDPLALRHLLGAVGVAAPDVDQVAEEVDVRPPQGEQLALAQAGERGGHIEGGVLLVGGVRGKQQHLVAVERVELARVDDLGAPCSTVRCRTIVRLLSRPSTIRRSL